MGKKIEDTEVKKECPSCGLGVALDSTICEFCGWDFEEEDEWILQIERLERDLVLEKQKFAPGTLESKIESTIHTPAVARAEMMKASQQARKSPETEKAPEPKFSPSPTTKAAPEPIRSAPPSKARVVRETEETPVPETTVLPQSEAPKKAGVERRMVRTVKQPPAEQPERTAEDMKESGAAPAKKTRLLRKVKK